MKFFIFFLTFILSFSLNAKTLYFVMPENKSELFSQKIIDVIKLETSKLKKGDSLYFIDGENKIIICGLSKLTKRLPQKKFKNIYRIKPCKKEIKLKSFIKNKTANSSNYVDFISSIDLIGTKYVASEKDEIFLFGSPFYKGNIPGIDFKKGVPTLGHIDEKTQGLTPFTLQGKTKQKKRATVHILFPSDTEIQYFNDSEAGIEKHKTLLNSFWERYFDKRNLSVGTYGKIQNGISINYASVLPTDEYASTNTYVGFFDLVKIEADKKEAKKLLELKRKQQATLNAQRERIAKITSKEAMNKALKEFENEQKKRQKKIVESLMSEVLLSNVSGGTEKVYEKSLSELKFVRELILIEHDGDNSGKNKIKIIAIDDLGRANELARLIPSGNNKTETHIVPVELSRPISKIIMYPIDENGNFESLGGYWLIEELRVRF